MENVKIKDALVVSNRENGRKRVRMTFDPSKSKTEQKHTADCNINTLINRYDYRQIVNLRNDRKGQYGFVDAIDFQEAMYIVSKGNEMFNELPSELRSKKFQNDPAQFLSFVQDPENAQEMVKLGLAVNVDDIPSKVTQNEVFQVIRDVISEAKSGEPGTAPGSEA